MKYERARSKFSEAVQALATSSHATIQQRLAIAYVFYLRSVEPNDPRQPSPHNSKNKLTLLATQTLSLQDAVLLAKDLVRTHHFLEEQHELANRTRIS
jgi:hypothetical protein